MKMIRKAAFTTTLIVAATVNVTQGSLGHAQARAMPRFTTVTVKPGGIFGVAPTIAEGRFVWLSASPILLVRYAYEVSSPTIDGRIPVDPGYDIEATFPASATPGDIRDMLKGLLIDKFGLRVHKQNRQMSIFRMTVAPGGPRLTATAGRAMMVGPRTLQPGGVLGARDPADGRWHTVAPGVSASAIARIFAESLGQPVLDATGIRGIFDIDVVVPEGDHRDQRFRTAFLATVPQQLGLELGPSTGTVEMLAIDRITLP
jgi:uncharacterized protein (TIGR03435 family)